MQRRKFGREFKVEAVRLVRERGSASLRQPAISMCTRRCCNAG